MRLNRREKEIHRMSGILEQRRISKQSICCSTGTSKSGKVNRQRVAVEKRRNKRKKEVAM